MSRVAASAQGLTSIAGTVKTSTNPRQPPQPPHRSGCKKQFALKVGTIFTQGEVPMKPFKHLPFALLVLLLFIALSPDFIWAQTSTGDAGNAAPHAVGPNARLVKKSKVIIGFRWVGDQVEYPPARPGEDASFIGPVIPYFGTAGLQIHGDTFPMTWADDDEIYTSAGDPSWGGKGDGLDIEKFSGEPPHYTISRVNPMSDYKGYGGKGAKPSGMISVNGVLYLAFQNLLGAKPPAYGEKSQHGSDATVVSSRDHGKTWTPAFADIKTPMFPGSTFGGPAFVNAGKNNQGAPDRYVYAVSTDQWDNGSNLRVGRVSADRIQDASAWEWISELKNYNRPRWSSNLQQAAPVLTDERRMSIPEIVYIASIKRYVLLTWGLNKDFSPDDGTELRIYDALLPWGPFTLVHSEAIWESIAMNPYCARLPLKWLKTNGDELVGWMQFSGSWRKDSLQYRSHVREFKMKISRQTR
jgi:hypothetical protein